MLQGSCGRCKKFVGEEGERVGNTRECLARLRQHGVMEKSGLFGASLLRLVMSNEFVPTIAMCVM
jgi:hypothetical protein